MLMYELPKFKMPKISFPKFNRSSRFLILMIFISTLFGFLGGAVFSTYFYSDLREYLSKMKIELPPLKEIPQEFQEEKIISQEEAIIKVVKEVSPSVVSIIVTKDLPIFEEYYLEPFKEFEEFFGEPFEFKIPQYRQKGTEKKEIGGGTGFVVSEDGLILTNKHVVADTTADYTVFTNDGRKFDAQVLAKDPVQDLAILKIETEEKFPVVKLGDSDNLQIGQTVIAIGNVLGEFKNSVSVGVISGLGRKITASGGGFYETIEDVIQTDAAINRGNSGGPLLDLKGQVIGINTALALGAENIGFAIPINKAKKDIKQVKEIGKIVYPFLGVYYTLITEELKEQYGLLVDYGAWIGRDRFGGKTEVAIFSDSAAEKVGLQRDDIILEFNGERITLENSLAKIIMKYDPGDEVILKILRNGQEKTISVILGEKSE